MPIHNADYVSDVTSATELALNCFQYDYMFFVLNRTKQLTSTKNYVLKLKEETMFH